MERIAVLSDVHGNMTAFDAVASSVASISLRTPPTLPAQSNSHSITMVAMSISP